MLPPPPTFPPAPPPVSLAGVVRVSGPLTLAEPLTLDGLLPERVPAGRSLRIVALLPGGRSEPLVWLHDYDDRTAHPFFFRKALCLPAGTVVHGVSRDVTIALLPHKL